MSKFELFKDKIGEWRFNFIARNGKVVCSSEGYKTKQGALNGIYCIQDNAELARIVE